MRNNSAELFIYSNSQNILKRITDLHEYIIKERTSQSGSFESTFNYKDNEFNLFINNGEIKESWDLRKKFDNELRYSLSLNIFRNYPDTDICLKEDRDFILKLLHKRLISCAFFNFGYLKEKKSIFSSKFHESFYIGFEYSIFISLFIKKNIYNLKKLKKYHCQIQDVINNNWETLLLERQIIQVKKSEFISFFENVNTIFSRELINLVKS